MDFHALIDEIDVQVGLAERIEDPDMTGCSVLPMGSFADSHGYVLTPMYWFGENYTLGYMVEAPGVEDYAVKYIQLELSQDHPDAGRIDALASRLAKAAAPYERLRLYRLPTD